MGVDLLRVHCSLSPSTRDRPVTERAISLRSAVGSSSACLSVVHSARADAASQRTRSSHREGALWLDEMSCDARAAPPRRAGAAPLTARWECALLSCRRLSHSALRSRPWPSSAVAGAKLRHQHSVIAQQLYTSSSWAASRTTHTGQHTGAHCVDRPAGQPTGQPTDRPLLVVRLTATSLCCVMFVRCAVSRASNVPDLVLRPGDLCDVYDRSGSCWYVASVISVCATSIRVHFQGWHAKHDRDVPRARMAELVRPLHSYTEEPRPEEGCHFISDFSCAICGDGGEVLCCDTCPKVSQPASQPAQWRQQGHRHRILNRH